MRKEIKAHVAWMEKKLRRINDQIDQTIKEDEQMCRKAQKITLITGLGRVSAFTLLCYLPELGTLSRREIAALAGLAPYNRDSGNSHRKRHIYGGRAHVRACLYMAALAATQHDAYTARYYRHLVEDNHKPKKVALVAVMRKMLIAANSMLKNPEFQLAN
jgi:transposase